jgi:hypothetical protein
MSNKNNRPEDVPHAAVKFDGDKIRYELIAPEAQKELARVLTFGAKKYDDHNWRKGFAWSRLDGSLERHLQAWRQGEEIDPESGLPHLGHAYACLMMLLSHTITNIGVDDRICAMSSTEEKIANAAFDLRDDYETDDLDSFIAKLIKKMRGVK